MSQAQLLDSKPESKPRSIVLLQPTEMQEVMQLDQTLQECRNQLVAAAEQPMLKAFVLARATNKLRTMLTDKMMADVMQLMGSPLGFKTDRDWKGKHEQYTAAEIRDVAIVCMLDGGRFVGNEMNVIGGNYYRTKEQLKRRILEWPGIANFWYEMQVPKGGGEGERGALVGCKATWKLDGKHDEIICDQTDKGDFRIPVRVNSGQGADAILGKAERKLFWKVWQRLLGREVQDWDPDEDGGPPSVENTIDATITKPKANPLDAIADQLEAAEMIGQVDEIVRDAVVDGGFGDADKETINKMGAAAKERIKGGRGAGSKKGGGS